MTAGAKGDITTLNTPINSGDHIESNDISVLTRASFCANEKQNSP
jgi:hypothetical protein